MPLPPPTVKDLSAGPRLIVALGRATELNDEPLVALQLGERPRLLPLLAAAYSPCEANIILLGATVHTIEDTEYPFRGAIRMTVSPSGPLRFPFLLRIPHWAESAEVRVNSRIEGATQSGSFVRVERKWKQGDIVENNFPMRPPAIAGFNESISIERGPSVFAYNIGQRWLKLRDLGMTADWQVYPNSRDLFLGLQTMLTQNLHQLEADGIVVRADMSNIVLYIEYALCDSTSKREDAGCEFYLPL